MGGPGSEVEKRELEVQITLLRRRVAELEEERSVVPSKGGGGAEGSLGSALRRSQARYRILFENSPISLWEHDCSRLKVRLEEIRASGVKDLRSYFASHPDQALVCASLIRIAEVNQATLSLYGAANKRRLQVGIPKILTEASYPALIEVLVTLAEGRTSLGCEAATGTLIGTELEVDLKLYVVPGCEEDLSKVLLAVTDITERKRRQRQLEDTQSRQKRKVADRTKALATALEDLKTLLYIVSNDLRAPLINVKGFTSELRAASGDLREALGRGRLELDAKDTEIVRRVLDEDFPEALDFVHSSVNRINHFVNTLLRLSQEGKRELHMEMVDVEALVKELLKTHGFLLDRHQARVKLGPLPMVVADRAALELIFENLLSNAVAYLDPNRAGIVEVTGEIGDEVVLFWVRDNGRGISPEDHPKVFAPFRRGAYQEVEGEGMGLAYSQVLARRHGGHISCESKSGVGSTFCFSLSSKLVVNDRRSTLELLLP